MNKKKAIFLDRDGVINQNRNDYVKNINELKIFDFVGSSINKGHNGTQNGTQNGRKSVQIRHRLQAAHA